MNIIKNRKIFFCASLAVILLGLIFMAIKGMNYDIDFTGGTLIQFESNEFISEEEIRNATDSADEHVTIIYAGENKKEIIIKSTFDLDKDQIREIKNYFIDNHGVDNKNFQVESFQPTMGKEIKNLAFLSAGIAMALMLLYITIRFKLDYGLSAIIALIHDILVMVAVYSILQIPVNSSFIAAILTVVGYSINDTIVIFDRIRENNKLHPNVKSEELIDISIKQSIRRTINTSITTLIAIVTLYIFGVEAVKVLALPLIIGVLVGTYSSLFIASPVWCILRNRKKNLKRA